MTERTTHQNPKFNMTKNAKDGNGLNDDLIPFNQVISGNSGELAASETTISGAKDQASRSWGIGKPRTSVTLRMRLLILLICVLLLLLILFICLWAVHRNRLQTIPCLEHGCINVAAKILSTMDQRLSPCDNFYEYSCNSWIRQNHIPVGQNNWSILKKLSKHSDYFIKDLLENLTMENPSYGLHLAQTYYRSCMNESWIDYRGLYPLYNQIEKIFGGWVLIPAGTEGSRKDNGTFLKKTNFDLNELYLPILTYCACTPLFRMEIGQEVKNASHFLIDLTGGYIYLERENYVNETNPMYATQTAEYRNFMRNYSLLLGVPVQNLNELDDVYEFEKAIALRMAERSERDPEHNYVVTTIKDLAKRCPVLNWYRLFSKVFEPLNYIVSVDEEVSVTNEAQFMERCKLYKEYLANETGIRILHNVAVWQFLMSTVDKMPTYVRRLLDEFKEAENGNRADPERWLTCVTETQNMFSLVIDRHFVRERFDEKRREAATEMIKEIQMAFKENFASVTWMEEEDKVKAIEKVDKMKASVGYPNKINELAEEKRIYGPIRRISERTYFENYLECTRARTLDDLHLLITKDEDSWKLPASTVNAFYKENANHIYFPAGILRSPVYDPDHPRSLNYGGIGMVVGHEITHAFDEFGSKRDAYGNLRQWWSNKTRAAFEQNAQCMVNQYSNYSILNTSLNGKLNLGENIADNGGIKAAFKAFKKMEAKYADSPILPGVNFTSEQLFFISFAQVNPLI